MKYEYCPVDNKTECLICPRKCLLGLNQRGFCHIRKNVDNKIVLTSYGYTTGLSIDPIEKKPLYHFYPGSSVLSFGTLGCNMGCEFCQNWQSSKSKEDPQSCPRAEPEEIAEIAKEKGCKSVAFTYNDPVAFFEYAIDTAKFCHQLGIKTVAVTAGYINPEPRKEFFSHMDAANIDLKAFSEEFYKKNCKASLAPVLDTLEYVKHETDCWLEITTLLIEGENDSQEEITKECEWIVKNIGTDTPLHLSAFHPAYNFMDKQPTRIETLLKAYEIAKKAGLKYVYTGNILDSQTSATYCHNCKKALITRNGFGLKELHLDSQGHCAFCGTKCAGFFG